MQRRRFIGSCSVGACALGLGLSACGRDQQSAAAGPMQPQAHRRARLVDRHGAPLRASGLEVGANHVFHYPYVSTPAFVFRLAGPVAAEDSVSTREGQAYRTPGGVGPGRSIVAYCAICVHQLSHPSPQLTQIALRERQPGEAGTMPHVISCCAQNSRFDPYHGGRVVSGPADQPLAAVVLEHDPASDQLHATGLVGGVVFARFFDTFARRLQLEHPAGGPAQPVQDDVVVHRLEDYSGNILRC